MLKLNNIHAQPGSITVKKRLGRGPGSGLGQTSGKGDKGQLARAGGHSRPGFEGGQMPLYRRVPKRGFKSISKRNYLLLNLSDLERIGNLGVGEISLESLEKTKFLKGRYDRLAVLGKGELSRSLSIKAHRISASAKDAIVRVGGSAEILQVPGTQGKKKKKAVRK